MLENLKNIFLLKSADKCIKSNNYDLALEKLNLLVNKEYKCRNQTNHQRQYQAIIKARHNGTKLVFEYHIRYISGYHRI